MQIPDRLMSTRRRTILLVFFFVVLIVFVVLLRRRLLLLWLRFRSLSRRRLLFSRLWFRSLFLLLLLLLPLNILAFLFVGSLLFQSLLLLGALLFSILALLLLLLTQLVRLLLLPLLRLRLGILPRGGRAIVGGRSVVRWTIRIRIVRVRIIWSRGRRTICVRPIRILRIRRVRIGIGPIGIWRIRSRRICIRSIWILCVRPVDVRRIRVRLTWIRPVRVGIRRIRIWPIGVRLIRVRLIRISSVRRVRTYVSGTICIWLRRVWLRRSRLALLSCLRWPTGLSRAVYRIPLWRKRCRFRRSCDFHVCARGLRLIGANLRHCHRTAAIRLHCFNLLRHWSWRWWWCGFCDYVATSESRRRTSLGWSSGAGKAACLRSNCGSRSDRRGRHFARVHANLISADGLRGGKRGLRSGGDGVIGPLILIGNVGHAHILGVVYVHVVIDIRDLCAVHDRGVRNVHALHVAFAHVIRRRINVARTEWEPRHTGGCATDCNAHSETRAANPSDQRWSVNRTHIFSGHIRGPWRRRHPTPSATRNHPTAVVERSETPGRVIYPRPSPRRHPNPVSIAVRRPICRNAPRIPDGAILRIGIPLAVFVEIFITDGVIRNVACRSRVFPTLVARIAPLIEIVAIPDAFDIGVQLVYAAEIRGFTGANRISRTAAGHFALTVANRDQGSVTIFVNVNAIRPGPQDIERQVWRVNFEGLILIQAPDAQVQRAFGQTNLHDVVVQIQKRKTSLRAQPQRIRIDAYFDAAILIGPEFVARGHRTINNGLDPFVGTCRFERNRAGCVAKPSGAVGRIVVLRESAACNKRQGKHCGNNREPSCSDMSHFSVSPESSEFSQACSRIQLGGGLASFLKP